MPWYVIRNAAGTNAVFEPDLAGAQAAGTVVSGPYSTQAQAQAAIGGKTTASNSGAGGTGAKAIYEQLLGAGFSTVQAIGLLANAINESRLDPEAIGDGGNSHGLWQFNVTGGYPDAAKLTTGNPAADITQQIGYLKSHISGSALNGTTGAQVAGNVAANFERCVGCQPGGAQYNSRVANAATVEGWISSGSWPTSSTSSAGGASSSGGTLDSGAGTAAGGVTVAQLLAANPKSSSRCLVGGNAFIPCLLDASQARGLIGGLALLGGGIVFGAGLVVLVAFGFQASGAARMAGQVATTLTPVGRVARTAGRVAGRTAVGPTDAAYLGERRRLGRERRRRRTVGQMQAGIAQAQAEA